MTGPNPPAGAHPTPIAEGSLGGVRHIESRDNPLVQQLRRLVRDGGSYRRGGELWLEGDHLCRAALARGVAAPQAVISESAWQVPVLRQLARQARRTAVLPDALFASVSGLAAPTGIGYLLPAPATAAIRPGVASVVLDRLQDPGNVGSILRSAAALGVVQVVSLKGTVALWSSKVLRAAMGAHFALHLVESALPGALDALGVPLLATSSHGGEPLELAVLPVPGAWLFGHEGQGADPALTALASQRLRIPQPGGEESLNVAAAAAICLYESMRRGLPADAGRGRTPGG